MKVKKIALVKGDGSAPEMMEQACKVAIEAAMIDNIKIEFVDTPIGWNAYRKYGDTLPAESLREILKIRTLFSGGVGDPKDDNTIGAENPEMKPEARALLALRSKMGLLLNFRPMIYYKELAHLCQVRPERIPQSGIKQIFIRFLLEDSYFGNDDLWEFVPPEVREKIGLKRKRDITGEESIVSDIAYYKMTAIEEYMRAAFTCAREMKLPLISVDKANIMARYDFWRRVATRIGKEEFPDVSLTHQYVDSANALLFTPALLNGVIACGNEHGDILSDGAAAALGSMGMMCSSAINPKTGAAMFESGAGTAPTLAGKDIANPLGRILTAALMLRHIGAKKGADAIEEAVKKVLMNGYRTRDIYTEGVDDARKLLGTKAMGEKILSYFGKGG